MDQPHVPIFFQQCFKELEYPNHRSMNLVAYLINSLEEQNKTLLKFLMTIHSTYFHLNKDFNKNTIVFFKGGSGAHSLPPPMGRRPHNPAFQPFHI